MKKNKILCSALLIFGLFSLSSCSLFEDSDIEVKNTYNPYVEKKDDSSVIKAGGVSATSVKDLANVNCFKNISYASDGAILNTYKNDGINYNGYTVNDNKDYSANKSSNNYDLYVPNNVDKTKENNVILFIHGGAWVSGFKTDVNQYVYEFARRGYVAATIKYSLLKRTMDDKSLSIFRDLDEIDACIKSIKKVLKEDLGFDDSKLNLVIGGASSGAHLSMLYAYSRGDNSALPIKFIIDAVGPTDIKSYAWKKFKNATNEVLESGITASAIDVQDTNSNIIELGVLGEEYNWNNFQTMKIANGMCGLPYSLELINQTTDENMEEIINPNEASNSILSENGGEDLLSVTYWMNKKSLNYPIICAYAGMDSIVGIAQYANLEKTLINKSISHEFIYFKNSDHIEITKEKDPTNYDLLISKIINWCEN